MRRIWFREEDGLWLTKRWLRDGSMLTTWRRKPSARQEIALLPTPELHAQYETETNPWRALLLADELLARSGHQPTVEFGSYPRIESDSADSRRKT